MGLRLASREVKRIELSDDAWIEVTSDISKRAFLRIITSMPDSAMKQEEGSDKVSLSISEATDFQQILFETLVQDWSLDVPVSLDAYLDLAREGADQIDTALVTHFKDVVSPQKDELGKPSTSPDKRRKG